MKFNNSEVLTDSGHSTLPADERNCYTPDNLEIETREAMMELDEAVNGQG